MHANVQLIRPIKIVKNIQKNINSHWMSDTNRSQPWYDEAPAAWEMIVEREISSKWLVDMLENVDMVNWALTT